jgi:site-specific DNA-methyltransferase (adenine-specific)
VALPERLIHLHTYVGDVVLDPFMGSGSTGVAAARTGRHYLGYDTDPAYVAAASDRIEAERTAVAAGNAASTMVALPAGGDRSGDPLRAGWSAKELAKQLVTAVGLGELTDDATVVPGVQPTLRAVDAAGAVWWFEVAGGRTGTRPGLQRVDVLWRAIAKASVVVANDPSHRFVILHCGLPSSASGGRALTTVTGVGRPVAGLVDVTAADAAEQLARLIRAG